MGERGGGEGMRDGERDGCTAEEVSGGEGCWKGLGGGDQLRSHKPPTGGTPPNTRVTRCLTATCAPHSTIVGD